MELGGAHATHKGQVRCRVHLRLLHRSGCKPAALPRCTTNVGPLLQGLVCFTHTEHPLPGRLRPEQEQVPRQFSARSASLGVWPESQLQLRSCWALPLPPLQPPPHCRLPPPCPHLQLPGSNGHTPAGHRQRRVRPRAWCDTCSIWSLSCKAQASCTQRVKGNTTWETSSCQTLSLQLLGLLLPRMVDSQG